MAVKEIGEVLGHKNAVRAFFVALALIFIIPVYFLIKHLSGTYASHMTAVTAWLIVAEVIEMGYGMCRIFYFFKGLPQLL